ncbi:MAG: hypothetical protein ABIQ40_19215 [Bacteroidia bacterium]
MQLVKLDGPFYNDDIAHNECFHYYNVSPQNTVNDSDSYAIIISTEIDYCDNCTAFIANAASEPGLKGTNQKIKKIVLYVVDEKTRSKKEITTLMSGNDSLKYFHWNSSEPFQGARVKDGLNTGSGNCSDHNCYTYKASSYTTLLAFRDTFNLNHCPVGTESVGEFIFKFDTETLRSFPVNFTLRLEIIFESGLEVASEAKVRRE